MHRYGFPFFFILWSAPQWSPYEQRKHKKKTGSTNIRVTNLKAQRAYFGFYKSVNSRIKKLTYELLLNAFVLKTKLLCHLRSVHHLFVHLWTFDHCLLRKSLHLQIASRQHMAFSIFRNTDNLLAASFYTDMVWPLHFWFSGILGIKSKNKVVSIKKILVIRGFISTVLPRQVKQNGDRDGDGGSERRAWLGDSSQKERLSPQGSSCLGGVWDLSMISSPATPTPLSWLPVLYQSFALTCTVL